MRKELFSFFQSDKNFPDIIEMKREILENVFFIYIIILIPGAAIAFLRSLQIGWNPIYIIQMLLLLCSLILFLIRKKLNIFAYSTFFLFILFSLGFSGVMMLSVSGGYLYILLGVFLFSIFFDYFLSHIMLIVCSVLLLGVGLLYSMGILQGTVDFNNYNKSILGWLNFLSIFVFTTFIIYSSVNLQKKYLIKLFQDNENANSELRKNENMLQQVFDSSPSAIYKRDFKKQVYEYISPAIETISGYTVDEFLALGIDGVTRLLHPDDLKEIMERIEEVFHNKGGSLNFEFRFKHKDGSYRWVSDVTYYYVDEKYLPDYTIGSIQDIDNRKKTESELKKSEELYRIVSESIHEVVWILDINTLRFTYISPSVYQLRGYTPEEVINGSLEMTFSPQSQKHFLELIQTRVSDVMQGKNPVEKHYIDEIEQTRKDGSTVWTEVISFVYYTPDTGKLDLRGLTRDITERRQAQAHLRESEARYQVLTENAPVGIFRTDTNGNTVYVNPKWTEIAGIPPDQAFGNEWLKAVHPDDVDRIASGWDYATLDRNASFAQYRFLHADGRIVWVMGQAIPELDSDGNNFGYIGTITDITEMKNYEQQLKTSEEKIPKYIQ